jgi:hypothetical protein
MQRSIYRGEPSRIPFQPQLLQLLLSMWLVATAAQCEQTPQDFEGWSVTQAHISLGETKTYQVFLEVQPRVGDYWQRAATVQGSAAMVYNVSSSLGLYAGYAWTPRFYNAEYYKQYRDENRVWQQVIYRHDALGIQWQHRLRDEQRFIAQTRGVSNRIRYMLKGSYALAEAKDYGLTAFDEFMFTMNSVTNGPWDGYDRNRFFFGPFWIVGSARYEFGYLGELTKRFGSDERWAHVILLVASFNFGSSRL